MDGYHWIKNRRIKNEIIKDLQEFIIDVGIVNNENQNISYYSEQFQDYQDKSNIYLTYFLDIYNGLIITISFDDNYPFRPPKNIKVNGHDYISLLSIDQTKLKFIGLKGCLCCKSITCSKSWSPSVKIKLILQEIEQNMNLKKKIVNTLLSKKICQKYLIDDINISQYL